MGQHLSPVSAAAALARIPTGAHLVSPPGMGAPTTLLAALGEASGGRGWGLSSGILLDEPPFLPAVDSGELAYRTWHVSGPLRDRVAKGTVGYVPTRASGVPGLLRRWGVGAALVRVSPPDADGRCSLGPTASYTNLTLELAEHVVAEIDENVPFACGDNTVHVSRFDSVVESVTPVAEYRPGATGELSRRIADTVLGLLPRDPTLQIGLGGVPESLVRALPGAGLGHLRFAGMATDEMVDLFEAGVLDPADVAPLPAVLSPEMMGTSRLLRLAHRNPAIVMARTEVAQDPARLGQIERLVSINTGLEIDLQGNVNCEVLAGRQVSGPGGGPDFIDGAARSAGGLRIVALPSASSDGSVSRVTRAVEATTISRTMVDVVVTEHGVARLAGLSLPERAEALIAIAHPAHRDALAAG